MAKTGLIVGLVFLGILLVGCLTALIIINPFEKEPYEYNLTASDEKLIFSQNDFGFEVLEKLNNGEDANIFISPSSIALALSMTYNGADGQTKQEMADVLRLNDLSIEEVNLASNNLIKYLENPDPDIKLYVANSIWANEQVEFKQDFLETNKEYYDAEVTSLPFDSKAIRKINGWVDDNTNGKIDKILDGVGPNDIMYLINAIYFKGDWTEKFKKKNTEDREFTLDDGTKIMTPLMKNSDRYSYLENDEFQAINMPYGDSKKISMFVFLPKDDSSEFVNNLNSEDWDKWMKDFKNKEGTILMPKFKTEYEKELNEILIEMGMSSSFDENNADFSNLAEIPGQNVYIGFVKHKTYVDVYEEGTEAAAVTVVGMRATSAGIDPEPPFYMEVNKPFFFVIRDNESGANLFMGYITDPRSSDK